MTKFPVLYKFATDKKRINSWEIEVNKHLYRTISGFHGMALTTSAWTACGWKNVGKSNECNPEEQALAEAEALHRKRIEKGYVDDIKLLSKKTKNFEPMLAKDLDDYIDKLEYPVWSQAKYDGVRCPIDVEGMFTRNGKRIISAPHIYESLKPLFDKYPGLILDGELFCEKEVADFNTIISLVRKTKPTPEDLIESKKYIKYYIYDIPSVDRSFYGRNEFLSTLELPEYCVLVDTFVIQNKQELMDKYDEYISKGYEGQMIRTGGLYENKRSKYLLKHKTFKDEEFIIKGVLEGEGNLANKVGKLQFETANGIKFEAAINAPWPTLEEYWKKRAQLIGKTATVKYFEKTADGSLRFPKVTQIDRSWE